MDYKVKAILKIKLEKADLHEETCLARIALDGCTTSKPQPFLLAFSGAGLAQANDS